MLRDGFLAQFVEKKIRTYDEPTRQGTPRGEPVGLSKTKYKAALLALASLSVKEVAAGLNISYGLLRKWRSEPVFKDVIAESAHDLVENLLEEVRRRANEEDKAFQQFLDRPSTEIAQQSPERISYDDLAADLAQWGMPALLALRIRLEECMANVAVVDEFADLRPILRLLDISDTCYRMIGSKPIFGPSLLRELEAHKDELCATMLDAALEILIQPKVSATERKTAVYILSTARALFANRPEHSKTTLATREALTTLRRRRLRPE